MFAKSKTAGSESQCKVEEIEADNPLTIDQHRGWQVAGEGTLFHTAFHSKDISEFAL
jgi:hypothetical protein